MAELQDNSNMMKQQQQQQQKPVLVMPSIFVPSHADAASSGRRSNRLTRFFKALRRCYEMRVPNACCRGLDDVYYVCPRAFQGRQLPSSVQSDLGRTATCL